MSTAQSLINPAQSQRNDAMTSHLTFGKNIMDLGTALVIVATAFVIAGVPFIEKPSLHRLTSSIASLCGIISVFLAVVYLKGLGVGDQWLVYPGDVTWLYWLLPTGFLLVPALWFGRYLFQERKCPTKYQ